MLSTGKEMCEKILDDQAYTWWTCRELASKVNTGYFYWLLLTMVWSHSEEEFTKK